MLPFGSSGFRLREIVYVVVVPSSLVVRTGVNMDFGFVNFGAVSSVDG